MVLIKSQVNVIKLKFTAYNIVILIFALCSAISSCESINKNNTKRLQLYNKIEEITKRGIFNTTKSLNNKKNPFSLEPEVPNYDEVYDALADFLFYNSNFEIILLLYSI